MMGQNRRNRLYFLQTAFTITILVMAPDFAALAQTKVHASLPKVPITYPGDTEMTIARRAHWIERARKEGSVVWWGSDRPEEIRKMADEFNRIYPFIRVSYWRGQDKEREARIESEHALGRLTVDICDAGGDENYPRWRKIGLVDTYTDVIPGIEKRDKRMQSKFGDWAQVGNNAIVPIFNTKLVSPSDAPRSWEDLLHPQWKGKIGLTTDVKAWYVLALGDGGWGMEKSEELLRRLRLQNPVWAPGHTAGHNLMLAGEFPIMAENYLRYALQSLEKGEPAAWCKVQPIPVTGGTFFLAKRAPHPNAARLFIEWLFSPPGLLTYEKITGYGAAASGSGTRLSKALEGLSLVYRTEDVVSKAAELNLIEKYADLLGITPK